MAYVRIPAELALTLATVVDEGSLDAAAAALHVTQPAVSQRLSTLERLTGQVLLIRSRPPRLTPAGEAVAAHGRRIGQMDAQLAAEIGAGGQASALPIAVNADSLATWMLAPLAALARERGITVHLFRDDEDYTHRLLADGKVMAAVTTRAQALPGCSSTPLGTLAYLPVAERGFAATHFPTGADATTLAVAPVVDFDERDDLQTAWLLRMGVDPALPPRHRVPASTQFAQAIAVGMGWGLLPEQQRAPHADRLVPLADEPIVVPLFWQRWRGRSSTLDAVGDAIVAAARLALDQSR